MFRVHSIFSGCIRKSIDRSQYFALVSSTPFHTIYSQQVSLCTCERASKQSNSGILCYLFSLAESLLVRTLWPKPLPKHTLCYRMYNYCSFRSNFFSLCMIFENSAFSAVRYDFDSPPYLIKRAVQS